MSEVDFVEELKAVAERSLKMAMENEEVLRQKQELVQHGQVQERLEQCRLAVLAVANEDGLKEKTKAGLKICLIKMNGCERRIWDSVHDSSTAAAYWSNFT